MPFLAPNVVGASISLAPTHIHKKLVLFLHGSFKMANSSRDETLHLGPELEDVTLHTEEGWEPLFGILRV